MHTHAHSKISIKQLAGYLLASSILLVGLFFRVHKLGHDPFFQDQAATSMGALEVVDGSWPLVGPMSFSFSTTLRDPPLPSYLYALPFAVSGDPRLARLFTAMWNILALALAFRIGSRYFGVKAGVLASLLYAVHPTAVLASRFIWNPNLAAPLVMLYVYTGLAGYYESKPITRILHFPSLALAILCHPALVLLAPVSVVFWLWSWWQHRCSRRILYIHTALSTLSAILILAPWLVGNLLIAYSSTSQDSLNSMSELLQFQSPDPESFMPILAGEGCWRNQCPMLSGERPEVYLTHILPSLTLAATICVLLLGILRGRTLPALGIAMAFFLPPVIASVIGPAWYHYVWPLIGNAVLLQAAAVTLHHDPLRLPPSKFLEHPFIVRAQSFTRLIYTPIIAVILIGQIRFNLLYDPSEGLPSLNDTLSAITYALRTADRDGVELILQDYQPPHELRCVGCRGWETLPTLLGHNLRLLPQDSGMPIPDSGAYLMRVASWPHQDDYTFGEVTTVNNWFQIIPIGPGTDPNLDIAGERSYSFKNGAVVHGFAGTLAIKPPEASSQWTPSLVWQTAAKTDLNYKFFAHLVDHDGNTYAQVDPLALPGRLWRPGEYVVSRLNFHVDEKLPLLGPLFIEFGMYGKNGNVLLLAQDGTPYGDRAQIQIRGTSPPPQIIDDNLVLDEINMANEQPEGAPLIIDAVWRLHSSKEDNYWIQWSFTNSSNERVFLQSNQLDLPSGTSLDAAIRFISRSYELRIPTVLAPGAYKLTMQLQNSAGAETHSAFTRPVFISQRLRSYTPYVPSIPLVAQFGSLFRLDGYDLQETPTSITLHLNWKALLQPQDDYKYFVHLWHNGQIITQVDTMPASGQYPTSWWAEGEYYTDSVTIDLPALEPGDYNTTLGWYQPTSGKRLPVTTPMSGETIAEWITLHQFQVGQDH